MSSNATTTSESGPHIIKIDLDNIKASCRACMGQSEIMINIFNSEQNIFREIEFCTGISPKTDDNLPSKICKNCCDKLYTAYKFKKLYLHADESLRKLLTSKITVECEFVQEPVIIIESDTDITDIKLEVNETKWEMQSDDEDKQFLEKVKDLDVKCETRDVTVTPNRVKRSRRLKAKSNDSITSGKKNHKATKSRRPLRKNKFKKLVCEPCNITFNNSEESKRHRKETHDKGNFICEHCGKLFVHRATHYSHVQSHRPPRYGCDQCDYKAFNKQSLFKHMKIHLGLKQFQCEFCTSAYHNMSNLNMHIKRKHTARRPAHQCTLCERGFHDKTKLNRHIDSHNDVKRFQCEHCHSAFTRRCYWKKHLLQQHSVVTPAQRPGRQRTNIVVGDPDAKVIYISKDELCSKLKIDLHTLTGSTELKKTDVE